MSSPPLQRFAVTADGPVPLPLPPGAATLHDLFGDVTEGVYSALCTFDHNKFLGLDAHIDRMIRSMNLLGWDYELDRPALGRALDAVVTAAPWPDSRVRFDVLPAAPTHLGVDSRVLIGLAPFDPPPPHFYTAGVRADPAPPLARHQPLAKTADFVAQRQAYQAAHEDSPAYEHLLVRADGRLLEGTGSNFYAVRDGVVWTAGADVLEGIARKIILGLLPELGIPLRLEAVRLADVPSLDEAAMSSASRALIPIVNIGGQMVGDGRPGPITRRILAAYHDYLADHLRRAV